MHQGMHGVVVLILAVVAIGLVSGQNNGVSIGTISSVNAKSGQQISGEAYASSVNAIHLVGFTLDQTNDEEYHFAGSRSIGSSSTSDADITIFPNEYGETSTFLEQYAAKNLVLGVPSNGVVNDYAYFGVWNNRVKQFVGGVPIIPSLAPPEPARIGRFPSGGDHGVVSGDIYALDDRRIMLNNFFYDGLGPDAFLLVGTGSTPSGSGTKVPDENGVVERKLGRYTDATITVTLPEGTTVHNIDWMSVYCIRYSHNFNHFLVNKGLSVPPYLSYSSVQERTMNCEALSDNLQILWSVIGSQITFELAGQIEPDQWMGFGLSGSDTEPKMVGSDVVVVDMQNGYQPRATDYYLSEYSQCSVRNGACPDTSEAYGGTDHVTLVDAVREGTVTRIRYTRLLNTGDSDRDKPYTPNTPQQIVWGIGAINDARTVAIHTSVIRSAKTITFGRTVSRNCPAFVDAVPEAQPPFPEQKLSGETTTTFMANIGNSGGSQGYQAITGQTSWGISWWINGDLIPRITLKRGVEYTFSVAGGTDPNSGMYHPFYITDDPFGGYEQRTPAQRQQYRVYAGLDASGDPLPGSVGDYCVYELVQTENSTDDDFIFRTYEQFKAAHVLQCRQGTNRGQIKWTPDANTPDEVYYQCYTHLNLGFIIEVVDRFNSSLVTAAFSSALTHSTTANELSTSSHSTTTTANELSASSHSTTTTANELSTSSHSTTTPVESISSHSPITSDDLILSNHPTIPADATNSTLNHSITIVDELVASDHSTTHANALTTEKNSAADTSELTSSDTELTASSIPATSEIAQVSAGNQPSNYTESPLLSMDSSPLPFTGSSSLVTVSWVLILAATACVHDVIDVTTGCGHLHQHRLMSWL